jgi:hypothetical protein
MKLQKHKNQNIPEHKIAEKSKGMRNEKKRTRRKRVEAHLFVLTQNWAPCACNCIGQAGWWGRRGRYRGILRNGMSCFFFPLSDVNHLLDGEFERKNVEEFFRRIHRKNPEVGLLHFLFGHPRIVRCLRDFFEKVVYWVALTRVAALGTCRIRSIVLGKLRCFPALVLCWNARFFGSMHYSN